MLRDGYEPLRFLRRGAPDAHLADLGFEIAGAPGSFDWSVAAEELGAPFAAVLSFCVIVDIDRTLANVEHREHLLPKNRPGEPVGRCWDEFFAAAPRDTAHFEIVALVNAMAAARFPIFVMTGRDEARAGGRAETERWLQENDVAFDHLWMRPAGDRRPDTEVKREMLIRLRELGYEPLFAVEDRKSVTAMWRANGVRCLQVCEGDY